MKTVLYLCLAVSLLGLSPLRAAEKTDAKAELKSLIDKVQAKLQDGKRKESDLESELKQFDSILAAHKGEKTDDVAQVLFMKAMLYAQVFENPEKGAALIQDLQKEFPETKQGKDAERVIAALNRQVEGAKKQKLLAVGNKFPDFDEKDMDGKPLSVAKYKGKVVLVDFWATWCGPCIGELPNVLKAYEKYHDKGFEIIGISLDKEEKTLRDFTKKKGMTWQQYFDGKVWENKLAGDYGVMGIPATFLLDKEGKVVATNLRGNDLEEQLSTLLAK